MTPAPLGPDAEKGLGAVKEAAATKKVLGAAEKTATAGGGGL